MIRLTNFGARFAKDMCLKHTSAIRLLHGSIYVGFLPNPEPTRPHWVIGSLTRRQPLENMVRFCFGSVDNVSFNRNQWSSNSSENWSDFNEISLRFG